MRQAPKNFGRTIASVLTVVGSAIGSAISCPSKDVPSRKVVLAQVSEALDSRTVPTANSAVGEYFACPEYQSISGYEFVGASVRSADTAEAIVQVSYRYTVSSTRIVSDLKAGVRPARYFKYSSAHLANPAYFEGRYFEAGTRLVVPGSFIFVRQSGEWRLQ